VSLGEHANAVPDVYRVRHFSGVAAVIMLFPEKKR